MRQNTQKHNAVALNFPDFFGCYVPWEPFDGITWFQAYIVEQLRAIEWWLNHGIGPASQNIPLFAWGTFLSACK